MATRCGASTFAGGGALGTDGVNVKLRQAFMAWSVPNTPLTLRRDIQGMKLPNAAGDSPILDSDGAAGIVANYRVSDSISMMQNTLRGPREQATEKLTTKEVHFSWELAQPRLRQWLYGKGHQDFFITLLKPIW